MSDDIAGAAIVANIEQAVPLAAGGAASPKADEVLTQARQAAAARSLPYAGGVAPRLAWELVSSGAAALLDVRSTEERKFVGHVPNSQHVAWATGTALTRNPRFVREVEGKFKDKSAVLLLLCRSGKRSAAAAEALAKAGFTNAFNVLEGFEGEIDVQQHRGGSDGWRFRGLPWVQD
jgi:rhodanese-related sulfurtransferase